MIVATRDLKYRTPAGERDVPVRVYQPQRDDSAWSCIYEIGWPDEVRRNRAFGVDAVQALLLACQMIGAELYTSDYHRSGKLEWEQAGKGYGFPVPASIRDLLVGDDIIHGA